MLPTLLDHPSPRAEPSPTEAGGDVLRDALLESRQRWRDLIAISEDIAFETDREGRFVFVSPDVAMGWSANALLGQSSALLLPETDAVAGFNPFRAVLHIRNRRVWTKRSDGSLCWMNFCAAPLLDPQGNLLGTRGVARDISEFERSEAAMARALRRGEMNDHLREHMRSETNPTFAVTKALAALISTIGADGGMIVDADVSRGADGSDGAGAAESGAPFVAPIDGLPPGSLLHIVGEDAPCIRAAAIAQLRAEQAGPAALTTEDGKKFLLCAISTRFEGNPGLVLWRRAAGRSWEAEDLALLTAAIGSFRVVMDHAEIQGQLARQARTDPLTGLHNRRSFIEEVDRRIDRLDRDGLPGTLMFVDLDNFKALNDSRGHEAGDAALQISAQLLRAVVRPGDLVARFGGDEFAIWLDGADELAAAERGEQVRVRGPAALSGLQVNTAPLTMSVGIATRWPGSGLDVAALIRRADATMYVVKRSGRGHWRVWRGETDDAV